MCANFSSNQACKSLSVMKGIRYQHLYDSFSAHNNIRYSGNLALKTDVFGLLPIM